MAVVSRAHPWWAAEMQRAQEHLRKAVFQSCCLPLGNLPTQGSPTPIRALSPPLSCRRLKGRDHFRSLYTPRAWLTLAAQHQNTGSYL